MEFPVPSTTTLSAFVVFFLVLSATAVAIEYYRRQEAQRKRAAAEWRSAAEIIRERNLSPEEVQAVKTLLERQAPLTPLKVLTTRHEFDRCVEAEMNALAKNGAQSDLDRTGERLRHVRLNLGLDYIPYGQRINSTRELHTSQWMSVSPASSRAPQWFRMMVEEVDEAYFWLSRHSKEGEATPPFQGGDEIKCRMWRDEDARYLFTTKVAGIDESPLMWRVRHTSAMNRVQARDHFRVRHDQVTTVGLVSAAADGNMDGVSNQPVVSRLRGRITSLSAGGCAVVLPQAVGKQMLLRVSVDVSDGPALEAEAKVVSQSPISGGRHLVRAVFVNLEDAARDRIAKYVLQRQQHMIAAKEAAE